MTTKAKAAMAPANTEESGDVGSGLYAVGKAVESVAEELQPLYKIEELNEALNNIAQAIYDRANLSAMGLIAQYGTDEDREIALKYLKDHFQGRFSN